MPMKLIKKLAWGGARADGMYKQNSVLCEDAKSVVL